MRHTLDFYETPPHQTQALRSRVPITGTVFECCVGDGSLARELGGCRVITNDINPARPADYHFDATDFSHWTIRPDWVVTNPPFNAAIDIVRHAIDRAQVGVVMLLRLSFLEPTEERQTLLSLHPPTALIVLPRWSYKQNGKTDSVTTAWFVWRKDGNTIHPPVQVVPKLSRKQPK